MIISVKQSQLHISHQINETHLYLLPTCKIIALAELSAKYI